MLKFRLYRKSPFHLNFLLFLIYFSFKKKTIKTQQKKQKQAQTQTQNLIKYGTNNYALLILPHILGFE